MRATDKVAGVREHAVHALKRLQDLSNQEDAVTQLLLRTLHTDSSKCAAATAAVLRRFLVAHATRLPSPRDVRIAVIQTLGVAKFTLPAVLEHIRDEKETVRAAAVAKLDTDLSVTQLKIAQRAWVVEQGLGDRCVARAGLSAPQYRVLTPVAAVSPQVGQGAGGDRLPAVGVAEGVRLLHGGGAAAVGAVPPISPAGLTSRMPPPPAPAAHGRGGARGGGWPHAPRPLHPRPRAEAVPGGGRGPGRARPRGLAAPDGGHGRPQPRARPPVAGAVSVDQGGGAPRTEGPASIAL